MVALVLGYGRGEERREEWGQSHLTVSASEVRPLIWQVRGEIKLSLKTVLGGQVEGEEKGVCVGGGHLLS